MSSPAGGFFTSEPPGKPLQVFLNSGTTIQIVNSEQIVNHFPGGSGAKNPPAVQEMWVRSLEKEMVAHSSILAWRSHGQKNLAGYVHEVAKELDTT